MTDNLEMGTPLFALGQVVATPAALNTITELGLSPQALIHRHVTGDWGDLHMVEQNANKNALRSGTRIFSSYQIGSITKIWVITEADRSSTTILLPEDY